MLGVSDRWICSIIHSTFKAFILHWSSECSLLCNVNVTNRISCFCPAILSFRDWGWPTPVVTWLGFNDCARTHWFDLIIILAILLIGSSAHVSSFRSALYLPSSVCQQDNSKSCWRIAIRGVRCVTSKNWLVSVLIWITMWTQELFKGIFAFAIYRQRWICTSVELSAVFECFYSFFSLAKDAFDADIYRISIRAGRYILNSHSDSGACSWWWWWRRRLWLIRLWQLKIISFKFIVGISVSDCAIFLT